MFLAGFGASLALLLVFLAGLGPVGGAWFCAGSFDAGGTTLLSTLLPVGENVVAGCTSPPLFSFTHLGEAPLSAAFYSFSYG